MTVEMGNLWVCDNPKCANREFIPRTSQAVFPPGWFNVDAGDGKQIVACGAKCLAEIAAAASTKNSP